MPRNGSGIYFRPPGIDGIPDHSIESAKYNLNVADVETDLNTARPVSAGGTGATNAIDALHNLNGELTRQVVTNYDSFTFASGSFYSETSATNSPVAGHGFAGICYIYDPGGQNYITLEARDLNDSSTYPPRKYIRTKLGGVWGAWAWEYDIAFGLANTKVAKAGDVMTGSLVLDYAAPVIVVNSTAGNASQILFRKGGANDVTKNRWDISCDNETETGGSAGSNFVIQGYSDGGVPIPVALEIERVSGRLISNGYVPSGAADLINKAYVDTGANAKVAKAGDTMSGILTVSMASGSSIVLDSGTGTGSQFVGTKNGLARWNIVPGSATAESGADAGSDLLIQSYHDAGTVLETPFQIARKTGLTTVKTLTSTGNINTAANIGANGTIQAAGGTYYFQDTSKYIVNDGTNFHMVGGAFDAPGITSNNSLVISKATTAANDVYFVLQNELGTNQGYVTWNHTDASLALHNSTAGNGVYVMATGVVRTALGLMGRKGKNTPGTSDVNSHNFYWNGTTNEMWLDDTNLGNVAVTCDYRIKKDVAPLASTWAAVKALKPISYTQAEFTSPSTRVMRAVDTAKIREATPRAEVPIYPPTFVADDVPRWGFIAHELQETLLPSAATGEKDAPDIVQSPNLLPIVAALTRALQEAMARIEELEARVP